MPKCDVCAKTSLLPEKFGDVNVCKICFMKANGFLWKHKYDRYDDAESQRNKVMENIHKLNFPPNVIKAINDFFVMQMDMMLACECCGQQVQKRETIGNVKICRECFGKINIAAWNENEYDDNEEVEKNRTKVLKIASKNNFPPKVIEEINAHFDNKIQKGLICFFDGKEGQKIKVFETHCVLETSNKFDVEDVSERYAEALKKATPKTNMFEDGEIAQSLVNGALKGKILQAGAKIAATAMLNKAVDKITAPKGAFKVIRGKCIIDYNVYGCVEYQECKEDIGYIRFRCNSGISHNEDILFFLSVCGKKTDNVYKAICDGICKVKQNAFVTKKLEKPTNTQQEVIGYSVADEILKFKNLLDQGIITEKEFEAKKNELLNL